MPSSANPQSPSSESDVPNVRRDHPATKSNRQGVNRWLNAGIILTIILLVVSSYGWTLDFPLVFDDYTYLADNPILRQPEHFLYPFHFTKFANLPKQLNIDPDLAVNFILRPVAYATFHVNYLLDGFNPRWYRAVNIAVHAINAVVLFQLIRILLANTTPSSRTFIAATAAAIFAVHPMAIESVTYIAQRFTSLSALFYLLALCLYFHALGTSRFPKLFRTASTGILLLGMLTKEDCVTAPIMAVLLDWLVLGTAFLPALRRAWHLLLLLPIIPGLVLITSAAQNDWQLQFTRALNIVNSLDIPISHGDYLITQITVVADYLKRLWWPTHSNLDPDWPQYHSLLGAPVLTALVALLTITGLLLWWHLRKVRVRKDTQPDPRHALALAGWAWFFVTIFVSSGLVPLPDLMADHRTYLPSCGIFALMACLLDYARMLATTKLRGALVPAFAMAAVAALTWATLLQNNYWRTNVSMWQHCLSMSPGKFRVLGNLGAALGESGRDAEALNCFKKALEVEPRFQSCRYNLAVTHFRLNQFQESLNEILKIVDANPASQGDPKILYIGGLAMANVGKVNEAIACLNDCATIMPTHPSVHRVLGLLHVQQKQHPQALSSLKKALELAPTDETLLAQIMELEQSLATR